MKNPNRDAVAEFKTCRNLYNRVIKTAKKLYFKKQLEINKKNLRKTWQILFSSINKSNTQSKEISHLTINGLNITDPSIMASHFNEFFSSIASLTVQDVNLSAKNHTSLIEQNPNSLSLSNSPLTKLEVLEEEMMMMMKTIVGCKARTRSKFSSHLIRFYFLSFSFEFRTL